MGEKSVKKCRKEEVREKRKVGMMERESRRGGTGLHATYTYKSSSGDRIPERDMTYHLI